LLVWDVATGEVVAKVAGSGDVRSPTFDGEGRFVAAAWTDEASVYVLDTATDRVAWRFRDLNGVNSTSFSPDGTRVAVSTEYSVGDGTASDIFVLTVGTTRRAPVEGLNGQQVVNVEWSPDGDLLAAGADEDVRIWDAKSGAFLFAVRAHTAFVVDVDWLPDEERRLLVSAGGVDGKAKVWKVGEAGLSEQMAFSSVAMTNVVDAAFSTDGTRVITANGSDNPLLTVWDSSIAGDAEWANLNVDRIGEAAFLPGRQLVASGGNGSVILWDVEDRLHPARVRSFDLPGHPWCCAQHVDVSADGSTVAISYWSGGVSVRDIATSEESFFVPAPPTKVSRST
jgi:WD40 repeat protein